MRSFKALVALLNKSLHEENGKLKLHLDRFNANVPDKAERTAIMDAIQCDPPQCLPFRDRFCRIEYVQTSPKTRLAIIVDADDKAVLIIHREKNATIWECHDD